jgi:hypothetical protein
MSSNRDSNDRTSISSMKETIIDVTPINVTPKKRRGIPLWTAVVTLAALAGISASFLWFVIHHANDERARMEDEKATWEAEKQTAEIERQKSAEATKAATARFQQKTALAMVQVIRVGYEELLTKLRSLTQDARSLRTSSVGMQVAQFPDLVSSARRLYEHDLKELADESVVISRLEGERRIESQIASMTSTDGAPDATVFQTSQADAKWVTREGAKLDRARVLLTSLISEARIKVPPVGSTGGTQTLDQAMTDMAIQEVGTQQRAIVNQTAEAMTKATFTTASAESDRIVNEAKLQAEQIRAAANAEAVKRQQELDLQKAKLQVEAAKVRVAVDQANDEARNVGLRARLKDPNILTQLAPLTTPGYLQVGDQNSFERQPISYSALMQSGAFGRTDAGLQRLIHVVANGRDKDRPRLRFSAGWKSRPDERAQIVSLQQLVIELGPTMVEQGLLSP